MQITVEKTADGLIRACDNVILFKHCSGFGDANMEIASCAISEDYYLNTMKELLMLHGVTTFNETWTQ